MHLTVILLLCCTAAFISYKILLGLATRSRHKAAAKRLGCQPAPREYRPDPLALWNLVKALQAYNRGKILEFIKEAFDDVSRRQNRTVLTYETTILGDLVIWTCDPKNVQALLATQFGDFGLGEIRNGAFNPLLGHGIFSSDGKQWEHSRALLRPQFSRDQVGDLELEEKHVQNMLKALPVHGNGWTELTDIQDLNFRFTMDSASEFLFGESVNSQLSALSGGTNPESINNMNFVAAFEHSQNIMAKATVLNEWYKLGFTKKFYDSCRTCHQYIDRFVYKALAANKPRSADVSKKEKYVFLEHLIEATQDPVEIRDQMLSIMVAGRDTTASLLSFLFLMLTHHPEVFEKLRAAIINDFGRYESPRNLTFSDLKSCSYLQWCLNETLRLFPSVPVNSRRSAVDTTLPCGGGEDGLSPVFVPKGTEVGYVVYVTHRHTSIWGPDAEKFIPERWQSYKHGFEYLPFNGGPRICLGQQFALTKAGYVTVRLLQRFDKINGSAVAGLPIEWNLTLTGRPRHGVKLRLHAATE